MPKWRLLLTLLSAAALLGALIQCSGSRHGTPLAAPGITVQPRSQTVTAPGPATFTVTATGTPAPTYQWYLGATAIPGATADAYTTPATTVAMSGNSYTVTASNGVGTPAVSSPAILTVNAAGARIMFFSSNWGNRSIMVTDDILALADGATASPRVITGTNVPLTVPEEMSLAVDATRDLVYVSDGLSNQICAWGSATTLSGNIAPDRTITISNATPRLAAIALDPGRDRLYIADHPDSFSGAGSIFIINNASTRTGTVTADAVLDAPSWSLFIDPLNDRLYVGDLLLPGLDVYDQASTLTSSSSPTRTVTLSQNLPPYTVWVDAATDRLYYGSRDASSAGNNLFVFAGASTLAGTKNPDTVSVARMPLGELMNVMVDNQDHLYLWPDSATQVMIYNGASTLSGTVTTAPDKTIKGVVDMGYGMGYLTY